MYGLIVNPFRVYSNISMAAAKTDQIYSTEEAAKEIGVSKSTLLRWFRERRIDDVKRDRNQWRIFTAADIDRIKKAL